MKLIRFVIWKWILKKLQHPIDKMFQTQWLTGVLLAAIIIEAGAACTTDSDCQLNGLCEDHVCKCDLAWDGDNCDTLSLPEPGSLASVYNPIQD
jgi:hypothetical protein